MKYTITETIEREIDIQFPVSFKVTESQYVHYISEQCGVRVYKALVSIDLQDGVKNIEKATIITKEEFDQAYNEVLDKLNLITL
jgi:hypothetical protein